MGATPIVLRSHVLPCAGNCSKCLRVRPSALRTVDLEYINFCTTLTIRVRAGRIRRSCQASEAIDRSNKLSGIIKRVIKLSSGEATFEVGFGGNKNFRPTLHRIDHQGIRSFIGGFDKADEARELGKALIEVADAKDAATPKRYTVTVEVEAASESEARDAVRAGKGFVLTTFRA
jgi:hypothetical protein